MKLNYTSLRSKMLLHNPVFITVFKTLDQLAVPKAQSFPVPISNSWATASKQSSVVRWLCRKYKEAQTVLGNVIFVVLGTKVVHNDGCLCQDTGSLWFPMSLNGKETWCDKWDSIYRCLEKPGWDRRQWS